MDPGHHLDDLVVNPDLSSQTRTGKYLSWAVGLHASSLESLLSALGSLGDALMNLARAGVELPSARQPPGTSGIDRLYWALHCFGVLHRTGRLDWCMPSGWDRQFSDSGLAFTPAFRHRLSLSQEIRWATDLSDRAFTHVLAAVGGYRVRVFGDDDDALPGPDVGFFQRPSVARPFAGLS